MLTRAWLGLLALSVASAVLTMLHAPAALIGAGILILALIKSRIILARYLDLSTSPAWLRGFTMVLTGFAIVVFALYLM
ncbi:Cytochrome C oxidase subunit IV [Ruegeria halocynthiae]|uniref:Cytochrome C oxidase subunit IV n=1 Tax=Ruegeria halocynthiae TaxID=985054 RepID=A0A1H3AC66_9RHOB|nr:Cytochrome C oxidase subunit IV [Ruegeria halocynthiae]